MAWCRACCQRQKWYGVKVSTPVAKPVRSLASRERKKEPCPQSWKMMKTRTSSAPARAARGSASHSETDRLRYIRYHRPASGTSVSASCTSARQVEGSW